MGSVGIPDEQAVAFLVQFLLGPGQCGSGILSQNGAAAIGVAIYGAANKIIGAAVFQIDLDTGCHFVQVAEFLRHDARVHQHGRLAALAEQERKEQESKAQVFHGSVIRLSFSGKLYRGAAGSFFWK